MKKDKKLKNLIEKQGNEIKAENRDFYERMLSRYPKPEIQNNEKPSFWEWFNVKRLTVMATAFVLVIAVSIFASGLFNKPTQKSSSPQISLPEYAEIVSSVSNDELMLDKFVEAEYTPTLVYGDHVIALKNSADIYKDSLDGKEVFFYITETFKDGFYRLQLITDTNYPYVRRITEKTQTLHIKGLTFTYSTLYALNNKMVYFFAESVLPSGEILAIDFTTSNVECEKAFIDLLNTLILHR